MYRKFGSNRFERSSQNIKNHRTENWTDSPKSVDWTELNLNRQFSSFGSQFLHQFGTELWHHYSFLADGHLHLPYRKLWMEKRSGWWRKSWIVGWSTGGFVTWSSGRVLVLNTTPGSLGIMFMRQTSWRIFTGGTLVLLVTSVWSTSAPFLSVQCRVVTALKGGGC